MSCTSHQYVVIIKKKNPLEQECVEDVSAHAKCYMTPDGLFLPVLVGPGKCPS